MRRGLKVVGLIVLVVAIAWLLARVLTIAAAQEQSRADRAELYAELAEQQSTSEALAEQIRGLGEAPVVDVDRPSSPELRYMPLPGRPGADGEDGRDGEPGARGPAGRDGPDGNDGADGESIIGPQGPVGAPGATGSTGSTGSSGPAGPAGAQGPAGRDGADGRGIASILCTSLTPIDLTITYSDGTTATVSCGPVDPDPEPPIE